MSKRSPVKPPAELVKWIGDNVPLYFIWDKAVSYTWNPQLLAADLLEHAPLPTAAALIAERDALARRVEATNAALKEIENLSLQYCVGRGGVAWAMRCVAHNALNTAKEPS
jgi:hypothetical protein